MSQPVKVDQGRVDHLAKGILKTLAKRYANPHVKFGLAFFDEEITECLTENCGPGTTVDKVGKRVLRALERGE